jgi:DNA-binding MarR family transcriptional regulator
VIRAPGLPLASPPPNLGEVLDFMRLIWAVDHALQTTSKRMKSTLGVTGPQRLVIRIVGRFPGIPAGQIAEILHVHPSTMTGILKRLERKGLIRRRPDPRDRRRTFVGVTKKGRRIDAAGAGTVEVAVERVIARAPRARLEGTRQMLLDLAAALGGGVDL